MTDLTSLFKAIMPSLFQWWGSLKGVKVKILEQYFYFSAKDGCGGYISFEHRTPECESVYLYLRVRIYNPHNFVKTLYDFRIKLGYNKEVVTYKAYFISSGDQLSLEPKESNDYSINSPIPISEWKGKPQWIQLVYNSDTDLEYSVKVS